MRGLKDNNSFHSVGTILDLEMKTRFINYKRLLSVKEAAEYLSISRSKLYQWIKAGKIMSIRIDSKRLLDIIEIDKFIERLKETEKCENLD